MNTSSGDVGDALSSVSDAIDAVSNMGDEFQGATADAVKNYWSQVHGCMLSALGAALTPLAASYGEYYNELNSIDGNTYARFVQDQIQELSDKASDVEPTFSDVDGGVKAALGSVSDIVSVTAPDVSGLTGVLSDITQETNTLIEDVSTSETNGKSKADAAAELLASAEAFLQQIEGGSAGGGSPESEGHSEGELGEPSHLESTAEGISKADETASKGHGSLDSSSSHASSESAGAEAHSVREATAKQTEDVESIAKQRHVSVSESRAPETRSSSSRLEMEGRAPMDGEHFAEAGTARPAAGSTAEVTRASRAATEDAGAINATRGNKVTEQPSKVPKKETNTPSNDCKGDPKNFSMLNENVERGKDLKLPEKIWEKKENTPPQARRHHRQGKR